MKYIGKYLNAAIFIVVGVLLLFSNIYFTNKKYVDQPNIVWLVTEDNSKHYLKLYDPNGVTMPNVETLAKNGIVFNHAFSQAPVCSVARSTIISGCYAPRIGAQYHRRMEKVPMPEGLEMFPTYLKKAGYYTTNNSKEDYNIIKSEDVWDESSGKATYKNRKPDQPFFHVQNFGITHEGRLHFSEEQMRNNPTQNNSEESVIFPYHPNTSTYQYTVAKYHDLHQQADQAIGNFLKQLKDDGLMDNTIIFYYGDHGGVLPRSKGYIYESGLHVPMIVYFPKRWKHLAPVQLGTRCDAFVQFIDLAPTVLNLAGVSIPDQIDGKPFLGKGLTKAEINERNSCFSYADRFDEKYDLTRALRKGKFKYIRNYQPFNVDALYNFYRYKMLAYQEWADLFKDGSLNLYQQQFFKARTPEALYDLASDPHEINNLADDPERRDILVSMRKELQDHLKSMPDLSFFPEPYFLEKGLKNPVQFGQKNKSEIAALVDIADLSLIPFKSARPKLKKALKSSDPWQRYWGLIVCTTFGKEAFPLKKKIEKIMYNDAENLVRMRAIEYLGLNGLSIPNQLVQKLIEQASSKPEANLMLNTVALLETVNPNFNIQIDPSSVDPSWIATENDLVNRRFQFINSK